MLLVFQFLATGIACAGVFLLFRKIASQNRLFGIVVAVGILIRSITGQLAFWVAFLHLPIARNLQVGSGLWFYAADATLYLREAERVFERGLPAIATLSRTTPSVTYVQTLSLALYLFGGVTSVALLINLLAYTGTCWVICRCAAARPAATRPAVIALAAVSLSPAAILWTTQPLKDPLFTFLIVAFIGASMVWQRAWRSPAAYPKLLGSGVAMVASLYLFAGIRWYFAFTVLLALIVFLPLVAMSAVGRRRIAFPAAIVLFFILSRAIYVSAAPYIPLPVQHVLRNPVSLALESRLLIPAFTSSIEKARRAFDSTHGATSIALGAKIAAHDRAAAPPATTSNFSGAPETISPRRVSHRLARAREPRSHDEISVPPVAPAGQHDETTTAMSSVGPTPTAARVDDVDEPNVSDTRSAQRAAVATATSPPAATAIAQHHAGAAPQPVSTSPTSVSRPVSETTATAIAQHHAGAAPQNPRPAGSDVPKGLLTSTAAPYPPPPTEVVAAKRIRQIETTKSAAKPLASEAVPRAKKPAEITPVPTAHPVEVLKRAATPSAAEGQDGASDLKMPSTPAARLLAGATAVLLPHSVAVHLGLLDIRGGRGLWWFADIDTVFFDVILVVAFAVSLRGGNRITFRNPVIWFVTIVIVLITGPLLYTVSNFGTLFRLRAMIYVFAALLPLALANDRLGTPPKGDESRREESAAAGGAVTSLAGDL
jgi:hypothetical protein